MVRAKATILTLAIIILGMWSVDSIAQGRGHGHGHHRKEHGKHHHHWKDHHASRDRSDSYREGYHERIARPVYVHQHHHECGHRVIVHSHERPRYLYYSDYEVYYDTHRAVYISYSGRNWTVSASIPVALHRVDLRRAHRVQVEYFEDDFTAYLDRGRPMFGAVYVSR